MRNEALEQLEPLIGEWNLTLTNAWFLDDPQAWEASEDAGTTWRKDFDLIFERGELKGW